MAHSEVTAHAGGALLSSLGAADVLDLLAQGLEGGVHILVTVADRASVVGSVAAHGVWALLLLGLREEVHAGTGRSRGAWGSGCAGSTLMVNRGRKKGWKSWGETQHQVESKDPGNFRIQGLPTLPTITITIYIYVYNNITMSMGQTLTAAPISPLRPRGPGGPTGPGIPFMPSFPGVPLDPEGPCETGYNCHEVMLFISLQFSANVKH